MTKYNLRLQLVIAASMILTRHCLDTYDSLWDIVLSTFPEGHNSSPRKPDLFANTLPNQQLVSKFQLFEKKAVPDDEMWARCENCALKGSYFQIFQTSLQNKSVNASTNHRILLSSSLWKEFFHTYSNDRYFANIIQDFDGSIGNIISRPVYILPMITFHIGHILIDLLEPLYSSMIKTYGKVRQDAIIILDVAGADERAVLQTKLLNTYITNRDNSFGAMFRAIMGDQPMYSIELLHALDGAIFSDVHIGLPASTSFYHIGYRHHPCIMSLHPNLVTTEVMNLAVAYKKFSHFIQSSYVVKPPDRELFHSAASSLLNTSSHDSDSNIVEDNGTPRALKVVFVQRSKSRVILNMDELTSLADSLGFEWMLCDELGEVSFDQQMYLFREADILVSTAGTAVHNMLFMRPYTAVIILMQPSWCEWAWMYANQAVMLDIHYFLYCPTLPSSEAMPDASPDSTHFSQWAHKFWLQGPRSTKAYNSTIDIRRFGQLLRAAKVRVAEAAATLSAIEKNPELGNTTVMHHGDELVCPSLRSGPRLRQPPFHSKKLLARLIDLYISSVRVIPTGHDSWRLAIIGDIGTDKTRVRHLFDSMPSLSLCFKSLATVDYDTGEEDGGDNGQSWCYQMHMLNYYAEIFIDVTSPVLNLVAWLQVSEYGGKIKRSEVYFSLDCRLPGAGLDPAALSVNETVAVEMVLLSQCSSRSRRSSKEQLLQLFGHPAYSSGGISAYSCDRNESLLFQHRLRSQPDLQRALADFCWAHSLSEKNCGLLTASAYSHSARIFLVSERALPRIQQVPTTQNPFVFIHIEKTGGTTMREFIAESAEKLELSYFIPCHGGVHCVTLTLPESNLSSSSSAAAAAAASLSPSLENDSQCLPPSDLSNTTVVAGHFFWNVWSGLPACAESGSIGTGCRPSVFVMGRHPIDRAISYYYQRCFQLESCIGYQRTINSLTPEELQTVALYERQAENISRPPPSDGFTADWKAGNITIILDEGMEDAACRSMAAIKVTTGLIVGEDEIVVPPELTEEEVLRALGNVPRIVVGILERWGDTLRVMNHWFPWIDFSRDKNRRRMFLYSGKETHSDLRPDLLQVLRELNKCDLRLYAAMQERFEQQMDVVDSPFFLF